MFEDEPEETDENSKKIREEVDEAKLWLEEEAVKIKKRERSLSLSLSFRTWLTFSCCLPRCAEIEEGVIKDDLGPIYIPENWEDFERRLQELSDLNDMAALGEDTAFLRVQRDLDDINAMLQRERDARERLESEFAGLRRTWWPTSLS